MQQKTHIHKCRLDALLNILVAHNQTRLLVSRDQHDFFLGPRVELRRRVTYYY